MIKLVLFDVDGVIVRGPYASDHFESQGVVVPQSFYREDLQVATIGQARLPELLESRIGEWGYKGTVEDFVREWFTFEANHIDSRMLELARIVREKGVVVAIASNQEALRAEYIEHDMGFGEVFDSFYFSCNLGVKKEDPSFFEAILKEHRLSSEEVFFVDDSDGPIRSAQSIDIDVLKFSDIQSFEQSLRQRNLL